MTFHTIVDLFQMTVNVAACASLIYSMTVMRRAFRDLKDARTRIASFQAREFAIKETLKAAGIEMKIEEVDPNAVPPAPPEQRRKMN